MWNVVYLLVAMGIALLAVYGWRRVAAPDAPRPQAYRTRTAPRAATATAGRPDLEPIPWNEAIPQPPRLEGEALRDRLRDRYIAARFPGLAASSADLENVDHMIRCARLCFEEEKYEQAHELLAMAIEQVPESEPLRLAQIEIAFLRRDPAGYVALAARFRACHPQSRNWCEVARLGRAIAPAEALFAAGAGSRPHEHYGPWPDMPNWIQASWDLTAEVLAADFHRAVLREPGDGAGPAEQRLSA